MLDLYEDLLATTKFIQSRLDSNCEIGDFAIGLTHEHKNLLVECYVFVTYTPDEDSDVIVSSVEIPRHYFEDFLPNQILQGLVNEIVLDIAQQMQENSTIH